jgi:hypothetical protein
MNARSDTRTRFRAMFLAELDLSLQRLTALPQHESASTKPFADTLHQLIGSTSAVDLLELGVLCRYCEQGLRSLEHAGKSPASAPEILKILPILDDVSEALHADRSPNMASIRALSAQLAPAEGP